MYQRPIQSGNSFKSYRANKLKSTDRHIRENHFFGFRGSQNVDIWKKRGGPILHKSNTFSDENVKIKLNIKKEILNLLIPWIY